MYNIIYIYVYITIISRLSSLEAHTVRLRAYFRLNVLLDDKSN